MTKEDFAKQHNHIRYCEVIVLKDGSVEHAHPSHTHKLMNMSGYTQEKLWEMIPITDSPIHYLIDMLEVTSLWYDNLIAPKKGMSEKQKETVGFLIEKGILDSCLRSHIID